MSSAASFETFEKELTRLVESFSHRLALTPRLRAATITGDRAVLQNAVAATDQHIDRLVYELYGLTEEEITLVEGHA